MGWNPYLVNKLIMDMFKLINQRKTHRGRELQSCSKVGIDRLGVSLKWTVFRGWGEWKQLVQLNWFKNMWKRKAASRYLEIAGENIFSLNWNSKKISGVDIFISIFFCCSSFTKKYFLLQFQEIGRGLLSFYTQINCQKMWENNFCFWLQEISGSPKIKSFNHKWKFLFRGANYILINLEAPVTQQTAFTRGDLLAFTSKKHPNGQFPLWARR